MICKYMTIAMAALALGACGKRQDSPPGAPTQTTLPAPVPAPKGPEIRLLALGDSLFAGYGLRPEQAYPIALEAALRGQGINAHMVNASVSGDTTADGLARLAFTLKSQPQAPSAVLVCLGGNDMLRGLSPAQTRANLDAILTQLAAHNSKIVLMGMLAAPNLGPEYAHAFNAIYPALAKRHGAVLVPFFMAPLIANPTLQQADHIHPTVPGITAMVTATLPKLTAALAPKA